ncbi:MAG: protein kinase [Myxococcales bacterium]|nr:protein kinase [Myxococcales bacterium]
MSEPPDRDSGKTLARPDVAAGQATVVREEGTLVREESTLVRGGSGAASGEEGAVTPETPGRYDVRSEYGRGGQSRVMLAFDQHMGREIALKQLLAPGEGSGSSGSQAASSRFVREARITGQLEHPNIVPVYELGQHADGSYYYTQKLVRGVTLKAKLREARSLAERLKLLSHFADICHAMAYAHSRGVVHRDLKPDNVMVGQFGETVVLDWGLAKARGEKDVKAKQLQRETEAMRADATMAGHALGTPSYMSPEQAQGNLEEIDERSDVWSLGAILFEILTGRPPFEGSSAYSVIEKVIKDAPPRVRAVLRDAPPELAAVAERALSREKALRYASAEEIAGEVEAYLTGGNVRAYQYSSWELLRRFVQKHRALTAVSGLALLLLIAALIVIRDEAARARAALGEARHNLAQAFLEKAHSAEHDFLWHRAEIYFAAARVQEDGPEARWGSVIEGGGAAGVTRISGPEGWVRAAAFSPDGQAIAAASSDGTARLFDLSTGRERWSFRAARQMAAVAFSSDGKTVTTRDDGGIVRILDASTGAQSSSSRSPVRPKPEPVTATSPDGKLVATAESRTVTLWDARSHVRLELLPRPAPIIGLAFSPDSKQVAIAEQQSALVLWNVERRPMARGYARLPDGGTLTVPTSGRGLVQRNADGKLARTFAQDVRIDAAAASPDGKRVAAVGPDGLVFIDLGSGRRLRSIASARGRALRDRRPPLVGGGARRARGFRPDSDRSRHAYVAAGHGSQAERDRVDGRRLDACRGRRRPDPVARSAHTRPPGGARDGGRRPRLARVFATWRSARGRRRRCGRASLCGRSGSRAPADRRGARGHQPALLCRRVAADVVRRKAVRPSGRRKGARRIADAADRRSVEAAATRRGLAGRSCGARRRAARRRDQRPSAIARTRSSSESPRLSNSCAPAAMNEILPYFPRCRRGR